jgi:hypothetical protein
VSSRTTTTPAELEKLLGKEFVDGARVLGRAIAGMRHVKAEDRWDFDLAAAYIESLTREDIEVALFAAAFMHAAKDHLAKTETEEQS